MGRNSEPCGLADRANAKAKSIAAPCFNRRCRVQSGRDQLAAQVKHGRGTARSDTEGRAMIRADQLGAGRQRLRSFRCEAASIRNRCLTPRPPPLLRCWGRRCFEVHRSCRPINCASAAGWQVALGRRHLRRGIQAADMRFDETIHILAPIENSAIYSDIGAPAPFGPFAVELADRTTAVRRTFFRSEKLLGHFSHLLCRPWRLVTRI
jgi:hypothetical protein